MMAKPSRRLAVLPAVIVLWLIASALGLIPAVVSTPEVIISEVYVTNVRDITFNVSWITDQPTIGEVH